jgi:hypothetical protein
LVVKERIVMNGRSKLALVLVFILTILLASAGLVWAKELGALVVSGPGIKGEVEIDGQQSLSKLDQSGFFDASKIVKAPEGLGEGYKITQFLIMESGPIEWQGMVYYPGAEGQDSFLYWAGPLNKDAPQVSDQWTIVQPAADQAFRSLLKAYGVTVVAASPELPAPQVEAGKPASEAQSAVEGSSASIVESQPEAAAPAPALAESRPKPEPGQPAAAQQESGGKNDNLVLGIIFLAVLVGGFVLLRSLLSGRGEPARAGFEGQD